MSPRRYNMTRKSAAALETRQRIVEATLKLHGEFGIFGTTWADIAREADVALGTVYRYFPTLEELLPACGELLMERTNPPSPDDIQAILAGETLPVLRLKRVAHALFSFYDRGGKHLETDLRERKLAAVLEWENYLRATVKGFVEEALKSMDLAPAQLTHVLFLFDLPSFNALRIRGLSLDEATATVAEMATAWLDQEFSKGGKS